MTVPAARPALWPLLAAPPVPGRSPIDPASQWPQAQPRGANASVDASSDGALCAIPWGISRVDLEKGSREPSRALTRKNVSGWPLDRRRRCWPRRRNDLTAFRIAAVRWVAIGTKRIEASRGTRFERQSGLGALRPLAIDARNRAAHDQKIIRRVGEECACPPRAANFSPPPVHSPLLR